MILGNRDRLLKKETMGSRIYCAFFKCYQLARKQHKFGKVCQLQDNLHAAQEATSLLYSQTLPLWSSLVNVTRLAQHRPAALLLSSAPSPCYCAECTRTSADFLHPNESHT